MSVRSAASAPRRAARRAHGTAAQATRRHDRAALELLVEQRASEDRGELVAHRGEPEAVVAEATRIFNGIQIS